MYGSDKETADGLRTFENGKLRSWIYENEEYCPLNPNSKEGNTPFGESKIQFSAGNDLVR